jgi:hypothetical protein
MALSVFIRLTCGLQIARRFLCLYVPRTSPDLHAECCAEPLRSVYAPHAIVAREAVRLHTPGLGNGCYLQMLTTEVKCRTRNLP